MANSVLEIIGRKLRKKGLRVQTWYAFGAAVVSYFVGNNLLPQSWQLPGDLTPGQVGDIVAAGLLAASIYELQTHTAHKIIAWLSRAKSK